MESQQTETTLYDVAIVGAGYCGTMVAANIVQGSKGARIALIDRSDGPARGLAYATSDIDHLLNVRAGHMGAFADDPKHFWRWLNASDKKSIYSTYDFVPRKIYGDYLRDVLKQATASSSNLNLFKQRIIDLRRVSQGFELACEDGSKIGARKVVLALGNFPPDKLGQNAAEDPYSPYIWRQIADDGDVLIVGTGLTGLDLIVTLAKTKKAGSIHLLSRHGLLPREHSDTSPYNLSFDILHIPKKAADLCRAIRKEISIAKAKGIGWQNVIDALRPNNQLLWQALSTNEKRRFLRHLRPYWDVHRHRCAPQIMDAYRDLEKRGFLTRHRGSILSQTPSDKGWHVEWQPRGTLRHEAIDVRHILRCTGPQADFRKLDDIFVQNLLASGLIAPDAFRLGISTANDLTVLDIKEQRSEGLYALGGVLKGRLFETIAVPELREQAAAIASKILLSTT